MAEATPNSSNKLNINNPLIQVNFDDPATVAKKETGLQLAKQIYQEQTSQNNNLNYFTARAVQQVTLEKWAKGTQDMTEFLDFMNVSDANKAYVKIDMSPIMVGPQFVGTLVSSIAQNEEYPCVTAVDPDSLTEKNNRKEDALFRMHDVDTISDIQQQAGVMVEPPNAYVPDDELMAEVYFSLEDRLPKEIQKEQQLEETLIYNEYERVLKRRLIYDLIVKNIACTKIEKENGKYCIRKTIPQNTIYNFFLSDNGRYELGYIGEVYNFKVRDLRNAFPDLTEKEVFDLARMSNNKNVAAGYNFLWKDEYQFYNQNRPWDDYSVYVFDFRVKISVSDYYVSKVDNYGKENIVPKQSKPEPKSPNAKILKKDKKRWYKGVYAPYAHMMLSWGQSDLSLVPYGDGDDALCEYSINIPFNNGDYVPSLFERAMEPLKEYAITKLKRKQLIAKLRPSGIRIDIESARNVDLGGGNVIAWEEIMRIYDQTGNEIWSSRGLNPNEREAPAIGQTAHDDTLQKIMQLTDVLAACLNDIRSLLGVPSYRDGSDVGDRTAAKLAEGQNQSAFNVTDFIPNALNQVMEETLSKICLLHWQDEIKSNKKGSEELINTRFKVNVKMKQTAYEKQLLEQNIQIAMRTVDGNGNPLLSFKDAFKIRNIKNYKLAELYLANTIEKNKREAQEASAKLQEQNGQIQQQTAQQSAEAADKLQQDKLNFDKDLQEFSSTNKKQEIVIEKLLDIYKVILTPKTGEGGAMMQQPTLPPEIAQLAQVAFKNVAMPLFQENRQIEQGIQQQAVEEAQMQEQAAQQQMMEEQGMQPEAQM